MGVLEEAAAVAGKEEDLGIATHRFGIEYFQNMSFQGYTLP